MHTCLCVHVFVNAHIWGHVNAYFEGGKEKCEIKLGSEKNVMAII